MLIYRALLKYGYSNFSLVILEYCDTKDLFPSPASLAPHPLPARCLYLILRQRQQGEMGGALLRPLGPPLESGRTGGKDGRRGELSSLE